jgi:Cu+-exporting ATPase
MPSAAYSLQRTLPLITPDPELAMVLGIVSSFQEADSTVDPVDIINLYISLKSKPLAVLVGPGNQGKLAAIRILSDQVIGRSAQVQMMVGHPFWASKSTNVALFTEAQTRFNTEKVLSLIEEAWEPKNTSRLYLGCLARISFAELESFFTSAAFQLGHGELMALPYAHFNEPVPFPPNLLLVGTMDTYPTNWFRSALLTQASIIYWSNSHPLQADFLKPTAVPVRRQAEFLRRRVRKFRPARLKLSRIIGWDLPGLEPVKEILRLLDDHSVFLPAHVAEDIVIYLANAWSRDDVGLFSVSNKENLDTALDFAVTQSLLPHVFLTEAGQYSSWDALIGVLQEHFPRAHALVHSIPTEQQVERWSEVGIDPVCGMAVDQEHAAGASEYEGASYHFCSLICKQTFDLNPGKYIER